MPFYLFNFILEFEIIKSHETTQVNSRINYRSNE